MRGWLFAIAVVGSACSSDAPVVKDAPTSTIDAPPGRDPDDGARSGTRLKLTWYEFSDGTRQWDGFYDAARKETCYIYEDWIDGKSYCAPDYGGSMIYADASCTTKVQEVYRDTACGRQPPPYAMEYSYTPCDAKPAHLYVRGNKMSLAQYYFKSSDGACNGPYPTIASYDYYAIGAEVKTSELVEVTRGAPMGPGRLAVRMYQSSDGMRLQASVHDAALGSDCYPQVYASGATSGSCAPSARYAGYDHDSACTQHKLSIDRQCTVPKYAVYFPANACPADPPEYHLIGAMTSGSPLYYHNGASCVAATPSSSNNYYLLGAELATAPVTRSIDEATTRLRHIRFTNEDGLQYRNYALYDSAKEADCYPTKLPDGTIRCVVFGGYVRTLYRDASCTQTIDLVEVETGPASCGAPNVPKYARKYVSPSPGSCDYATQVYAIGSPYTDAVYVTSGGCQVYSPVNATLYSLAAQVPVTDFVTASVSIDDQ